MNKEYFHKAKEDDEVFGLVFGHGKIINVWSDSHYTIEVEYDSGDIIAYTPEGFPSWAENKDIQTVFYKKDIDVFEMDFTAAEKETLSAKKIIKLRETNGLMLKCPSGIWQLESECPRYISQRYLEDSKLHLFKRKED